MEKSFRRMHSQFGLFVERALLWGVRAGLALLLLTPFVISENTVYPFVVGKALYARMLIEVVFALWVALACLNPAFRPPRSWLLVLLAAGFAWSVVAAGFGASPQRSLWSNYERMTGLVAAAHWLALVVVAASVLQRLAGLRTLLALNLGASVAVALLAVAGYFQVDPVVFGAIWERSHPRIGTVFGNPAYLGAYALVNLTVAFGFLVRSLLSPQAAGISAIRRQRALRLLLAAVAGLNLWALSLSGSLAAVVGLLGAAAFLAVAGLVAWRVRWGPAAAGASGLMFGVLMALFLLQQPERPQASLDASANPLLQRLTLLDGLGSYRARESAWRAGVKGFAERPWLGWGAENFIVVFGRHAAGRPSEGHVHDRVHNELISKAVAEGLLGVAGYLALWAFTSYAVVRAAKALAPRDRAFALSIGAALAGCFLMNQLQFDTAALKPQLSLLLAYAVGLQMSFTGKRPRLPWAAQIQMTPLWCRAFKAAVALGGAALAVAGLAANQAIHSAAKAFLSIQPGHPGYVERTIAAFPPLANEPQRHLFDYVARNWAALLAEDKAKAKLLLADAVAQAQAATTAEPDDWRIRRALARMHLAVATTEPAHRALAAREIQQALTLAPEL